ncbi:MAG: hypothetical protein B6D61_12975 [Bacteroidetes bacterium 4484_249]|nr:MAG: hypothetical protein B6D61_12975 [Bacteroidetes bacterium 4484_249]
MKTLITILLSVTLSVCLNGVLGVNVDSLKSELKLSALPQDSLVILKALTKSYQSVSIDSTFFYGQIAIGQAGRLNDTASLAYIYNYFGSACHFAAIYEKALEYFQKSNEMFRLLDDETGLAKTYNNIGIIYQNSGKNENALEFFNKSLDIWQRINEHSPDDPETKKIIAVLYNNIGLIKVNLGEKEKALGFYNKSLAISGQYNDKKSMVLALINISAVYINSRNYNKALDYLFQSLEISYETNDKQGIANTLYYIGFVYLNLKNYKKAGKFFNEALQTAKEIQGNEIIKNIYHGLYLLNKQTGDAESYVRYITLYHQFNDSIYNQESKNKIAELQNKYEFEKKEQEIKLLESEKQVKDIKLRNSKRWMLVLVHGLLIALLVIWFIYFQMKRKVQANKDLVKKNLEIVKSEEYIRECLKSEQEKNNVSQYQVVADKYSNSPLTEEYKEDLKLLISQTMEDEKLYLNNHLTIEMFSKHLNASRSYISQVINEKFNTNFNNFINEYRIKEARRMLIDEENRNLTIETIASMVGFGNKSSFNNAFKKYTGITPSFYMKSAIKD